MDKIPEQINKSRIRKYADGTYGIPRRDHVAEAFLDSNMERVGPTALRWMEAEETKSEEGQEDKDDEPEPLRKISDLFNIDIGHCYIVASGRSLDGINEGYFKDKKAPIICANATVFIIEKLDLPNPIFMMQLDKRNMGQPKKATALYNHLAEHNFDKGILFSLREIGVKENYTTIAAIELAKKMGAKTISLISFDFITHGDMEHYKGYPNIDLARFEKVYKRFTPKVKSHLKDVLAFWITPTIHEATSVDTLLRSQRNLVGHHGPAHVEVLKSNKDTTD